MPFSCGPGQVLLNPLDELLTSCRPGNTIKPYQITLLRRTVDMDELNNLHLPLKKEPLTPPPPSCAHRIRAAAPSLLPLCKRDLPPFKKRNNKQGEIVLPGFIRLVGAIPPAVSGLFQVHARTPFHPASPQGRSSYRDGCTGDL